MRKVYGCLLVFALSPMLLFGQRGTTGTISGSVTDSSAAVVPNAKVTATNVATGVASSAIANATGFYSIPNLNPGPYRLNVVVPGFENFEQTGIVLQVNMEITVNAALKVGSSTETVTVTGEAPLVNTRDQTLSTAITPQFTEQLPLNGRNLLQLMSVAPDTSEHGGQTEMLQGASRPEAAAGFVTASGEARENSTGFYLDGGLNMDTYTQVSNIFPNPDAIQEFTYDTNAYSAKYGGLAGGVVSAVTRGGTNQFHGSAFEYVRNGKLNGRNFFAANQDTLNRNQFGGSVGGPFQKDKMFGFFSFQRTTLRYATTTGVAYGPTQAELEGDWSAVPRQLYNMVLTRDSDGLPLTFTGTQSLGTPFVGNQVPTSDYVPIALKVLKLVPAGDPVTGRITYVTTTPNNDNQFVGRLDRNIGDKLRISGSILQDTLDVPIPVDPTDLLTAKPHRKRPSIRGGVNFTYSFGANLVSTLGASVSRAVYAYRGPQVFPSLEDLGANFPNWLPSGEKEAGAYTGWFGWETDDHVGAHRNQYDFTNGWTYTRGNHIIEFGGEVVVSQSILNQDYHNSGYTSSDCGYSGYSPLDFLMGQNCYYDQYGPYYDDARGHTPAIYVNDKWHVRRGLTLNLGVRWDPWTWWPDHSAARVGGIVSDAAFAAGTRSARYPNFPPGFLVAGDPGVPNSLIPGDWKLFDPRAGFAWDVRGNGKTAIRAGMGLYHDQPFGNLYNGTLSFPFVSAYTVTDPSVPWYSPYNASPYNGVLPPLEYPVPSNGQFPLPNSFINAFQPDFKPQGTLQWNFTVEQQLSHGFLLRVGYEASESWHMPDSRDVNAAIYIPGQDGEGNLLSTEDNVPQRRPWYLNGLGYAGTVARDESIKTSSYNGLIVSVEKRMTGNLSVMGGYRWAKCMDENTLVDGGADDTVDVRNMMYDRGVCNSDIASQLKMAVVYRLPSLPSWGFVGRNILGGWTMSGIWQWHDGYPFEVDADTDTNLDGNFNDRATLSGNPHLAANRSKADKLNEWFNIGVLQDAAMGLNGNTARNFLRGPGTFNLDYSLIKSFPIRYGPLKETQKIDFRFEAFNILNHANFNNPDNYVGDTQFGQILSASDPRIIQFALKFIF